MLYISTYTFCAWSLSTDTFQVLHEISIGDKSPKVGSSWENGHSKASLAGAQAQVHNDICHPEDHCKLHTDVDVCTLYACRMAGVLFSHKKVICLPSSTSRSHRRAVYGEGPGLIIHLTFYPIKPSVKSHHWWWLEVQRAVMCIWTYVPLIYF